MHSKEEARTNWEAKCPRSQCGYGIVACLCVNAQRSVRPQRQGYLRLTLLAPEKSVVEYACCAWEHP